MRKMLACLPLLAFLAVPTMAEEDRDSKRYKNRERDAVERRDRTERDRYGDNDSLDSLPRETRGHQPHDSNGDGVVSRREWPGNSQSFRNLDRNGDGVLSERDRRLQRRDSRYYKWQRRDDNRYPHYR